MAGFLDQIVEPAALGEASRGIAAQLATLDMGAHGGSKLRARSATLDALRLAIEADDAELVPPT